MQSEKNKTIRVTFYLELLTLLEQQNRVSVNSFANENLSN